MRSKNSTQKRIVHRLKIARGHLDKVISMAEGKEYCMNIILQSHAVEGALKEVDSLILENHLKTCVVESIKKGQAGKSIKELMEVFKRSNGKR
ncbi:MAG: hypothetical protein UT20_C0007G0007 [Candidatus Levybacteria bacterium GW2011_GWA1_39_11]|nr:MAG: hypothetical protein UT20_C0007G0007 [Candidatus Levybacteria bacterium GW2011_GWA1_39_11]